MLRGALRHRQLLAVVAVVAAGVLAVAAGSLLPWPGGEGATRVFTIDARRFAYSPERIRVDRGDRVILKLRALDVSHGLYIDGYGLEAHAMPGGEAVIDFVADRAGQFRLRCSVTCGPMHPFMVGQLNVESGIPYTNAPFLGVAAATLLVAAGSLAYAGRAGEAAR